MKCHYKRQLALILHSLGHMKSTVLVVVWCWRQKKMRLALAVSSIICGAASATCLSRL